MSDNSQHRSRAGAFAHAAEALELAGVLDLIAGLCVNEGAKRAVRALEPVTDRRRIEESMAEVMEMREYQIVEGRLPIVDTGPSRWIDRASRTNETIPAEGLLELARAEREVLGVRRRFDRDGESFTRLAGIVSNLIAHEALIARIGAAIDDDAEIKDSASPRLRSLRRSLRSAREETRRHAEGLAKTLGAPEYATYVGNRYMLLVPRDKCGARGGIVHGTSQSGGSLYFEPSSLVERNNRLETLRLDEQAEQTRVLSELTAAVLDVEGELRGNLAVWERLDALSAKGAFAKDFKCVAPAISENGVIRCIDGRHPLLERSLEEQDRSGALVPLNLSVGEGERVLVVSGPNAGGKTVALKTVGLLTLLFQCGLPVPCAEGSLFFIFESVYADIGDEQSITSSLSTFTSHLGHLDTMCKRADPRSLCLIDEIGDGTDPDEGGALAIATMERLLKRQAVVIATTHYGKVKTFALQADGVGNASMVFDDENDRPLYRLLQGTAGRSRGIETARRLEFCGPVIERAESLVGEETYRLERILSDLEADKLALERERRALQEQSEGLGRLVEAYSQKERELSEFKGEHERRIKQEAERLLVETRREVERIVRSIREANAARSVVRDGHSRLREMLDEVRPEPSRPEKATEVATGDVVSLSPDGEPSGRVIAIHRNMATVEIAGKRINVKPSSLYRITGEEAPPTRRAPGVDVEPLPSTTIDVRGRDRDDALAAADDFLDRAILSSVQEIKIIHGFGEGVLMRALRDFLADDPRVRAVRPGGLGEGGQGVTFVTLK